MRAVRFSRADTGKADLGGAVYEEDYIYDPVIRHSDVAADLRGVIYGCDRATGRRWFLAGDDTNDALVSYYECAETGVGSLPAGFPGTRVALAGGLVALGVDGSCVSRGPCASTGHRVT